MNKIKDNQKKTVGDLWPELIKQEKDFLLHLIFTPGFIPKEEDFLKVDLFKIEILVEQELRSESGKGLLRECLLRLVLIKIKAVRK